MLHVVTLKVVHHGIPTSYPHWLQFGEMAPLTTSDRSLMRYSLLNWMVRVVFWGHSCEQVQQMRLRCCWSFDLSKPSTKSLSHTWPDFPGGMSYNPLLEKWQPSTFGTVESMILLPRNSGECWKMGPEKNKINNNLIGIRHVQVTYENWGVWYIHTFMYIYIYISFLCTYEYIYI